MSWKVTTSGFKQLSVKEKVNSMKYHQISEIIHFQLFTLPVLILYIKRKT